MLFCKGKCIIISLLNGKSSEEFFLEYFGTDMLLLLFTITDKVGLNYKDNYFSL